jgi:uncharacterized protein (DUF4415 family)
MKKSRAVSTKTCDVCNEAIDSRGFKNHRRSHFKKTKNGRAVPNGTREAVLIQIDGQYVGWLREDGKLEHINVRVVSID